MSDPQHDDESKQPWVLRQWQRLRGLFVHDVVIGQVEEGGRNVVIGKNIIQIGSLQIPLWLASVVGITLVLITVGTLTSTGVLGGILYTIRQPTATPLPTLIPTPIPTATPAPTPTRVTLQGGFIKIVVADISKQLADGTQAESKFGQEMSGQIYEQLQAEYDQHRDLKQGALGEVKIWSGSTLPAADNRPLRWVDGKTAKAREQNAEQMANEIGADLLIYGHVTEETPASLVLEFYYRSQPNRVEIDGAQGRYQLGLPLPLPDSVESDATFARLSIGLELNTRIKTLAWLTVALVYSMLEQHQQALDLLRQGDEQLSQTPNVEGAEIYNYFIGREAAALRNFALAEEYFNKAKAANSHYARAYMGLGMLYYDRAQLYYLNLPGQTAPTECVTTANLAGGDQSAEAAAADIQRAVAAYEQALQFAADLPAYPPIESVAQLALATVRQLHGQSLNFAKDFAAAQAEYQAAATQLEALLPTFLGVDYLRYAGSTYLTLGQSYYGRGIALWNLAAQTADASAASAQREEALALLRKASDQYGLCIDLGAQAQTSDRFFQKQIIHCGCQDSQAKALKQLQKLGGGDG